MTERLMMSDELRSRINEGMLIPATNHSSDDAATVQVQALSDDDVVEGSLIALELWEGIAHKVSFQVPTRDCQFLLEGTAELDVMVSLGAVEELSWTPLMTHANCWELSNPREAMITLTVTKR